MFNSILIANRGEIACRIIITCRRLGIRTVAVYSQADVHARHVRLADQALLIGPAAAAESYLKAERIIEAARSSGAEAIHPGYGFLAENADFARAVRKAGLILIGPSPETMDLMGSKAAAKARMSKAGVPLIPGYHGDDQDEATLAREAEKVGFPLMLKAAAGGGGKGMRVVRAATDFAEALKGARREAAGAFGDERMILERYLETPRHIEAQVFADNHGHTVHLFERDCSSQRRHQKIIEEAPAPGLDPDLRSRLLAAAVRAAETVDYRGAGTVEFLVHGNDFFFLEMNTRLQVEHPVTEMITGQDLVEWQLRVAAGEPLPLKQDQILCSGHAMEARIYAEDPERDFVPSSGQIQRLTFPADGARVDTGVEQGDEVSMHYDPMIAKLIVHDHDRTTCRARLNLALAATHVAGPTTNLGFLQQLAASKVFADGQLDTNLLDRDLHSILDDSADLPEVVLAAAACFWLDEQMLSAAQSGSAGPWAIADGWRVGGRAPRSLDIECAGARTEIEAIADPNGGHELSLGDRTFKAQLTELADHHYVLRLNSEHRHLNLFTGDGPGGHGNGLHLDICLPGRRWRLARHTRFESVTSAGGGSGKVIAPMPGKVLEVRVALDEAVVEGQTIAVMEAMKMELAIKAPIAGRVARITVGPDDVIEADTLMIEINSA